MIYLGGEGHGCGRTTLLSRWGSLAAPLAVVTGAADMQFALPVNKVKEGAIKAGGVLSIQAWIRRTGAAGIAYFNTRLGVLNSYSDATMSNQSLQATDGLSGRTFALAIPAQTSLSSMTSIAPNSTGSATVLSSNNFNVALDMYLSVHIRTANPADSFSLIGYQLIQEA